MSTLNVLFLSSELNKTLCGATKLAREDLWHLARESACRKSFSLHHVCAATFARRKCASCLPTTPRAFRFALIALSTGVRLHAVRNRFVQTALALTLTLEKVQSVRLRVRRREE